MALGALGENAAHSISDAFSHIFNGICEASYRSAAAAAAAAAAASASALSLGGVGRVGRSRSGVYGCIRICGACGYRDRNHSIVLCIF